MTNKTMTLLRKKLVPTFEYLRYTLLQDASLREDEGEKAIERFFEIVKEALHWQMHPRDWFLHGKQRGGDAPLSLKLAHQENVSYLEVLSYVERLTRCRVQIGSV